MRISAKADYAVRAAVELAAAPDEKPVKAERIATAQGIPLNFLENILGELRHAGVVRSHRGAEGGFRLAKPADDVTVADVIRAVEGPLASVRGGPPEEVAFAKKVIAAIPDGRGVHMIDGKMQDDATWKQCKVMVTLAEMLAHKDPELARAYGFDPAPAAAA